MAGNAAERKVNEGPGAGALNRGKYAGSRIKVDQGGISNLTTGNINKGPGAGAFNQGDRAGCIIKSDKPLAPNNTKVGEINRRGINREKATPGTGEINFKLSKDDMKKEDGSKLREGDMKKEDGSKGNINIGAGAGCVNGSVDERKPNANENDKGITKPPTGNINRGPGAGAINQGVRSASIIEHKDDINFQRSTYEKSNVSVPSEGNINKGPGAGGNNRGTESASIINCPEPNWSKE